MAKRMRLPNGFGQISQIKGQRLRNKWRAMVTLGWTDEGRPVRKIIGYFSSYSNAYAALLRYHGSPTEAETNMTVQELYEQWSTQYYPGLKASSANTHRAAWKYCDCIRRMKVKDIRACHIRSVLEARMPSSMGFRVRNVLSLMFDYAIENDIVEKNYPRIVSVNVADKPHRNHISFTEDEMGILWENVADDTVKLMLIECYTGFRPRELLNISARNTDIGAGVIIGGMKTAAGRDRVVPIHERIQPLVEYFHRTGTLRLVNISYQQYRARFIGVRNRLGLNPVHTPHDCRKTFVTMMKKANADEYAIKRIVGHTISDITEAIYTERDIDWLKNEVMKI